MINKIKLNFSTILLIYILFSIVSCVPYKKLSYFNDINQLNEPFVNPREQKIILPFDNLYIKVLSIDEKTNQIFNPNSDMRSNYAGAVISYLVDEEGYINFPFVGKIHIKDLNTTEASVKIQESLDEYISNTAVIVKFIENKVTIMGEVDRQGVYSFMQDKLNIYEALSLGGGLTRFGDRRKIILIRKDGNKIMHHKLNLTDSNIAGKDYYYVLPNDVIVVEPMKTISYSYQNNTYVTILSSITTLIAVLLFTGVSV